MKKDYKDKIRKIREEVVMYITDMFDNFNTDILPLSYAIDSGDFPILCSGDSDINTYTLDKILFNASNGHILFCGSSSWDSRDWWDYDLDTDTLLEIYEYLEEHYGDIADYIEGDYDM